MNIVVAYGLSKKYNQSSNVVSILDDINLTLEQAQIVSLIGPSGSGKTTLLQIIGLIDNPTSGTLSIDGIDCTTLSEEKLTLLRREKIGYIYQSHHLLPEFSAIENVMMPLLIKGSDLKTATQKATNILVEVGLAERLHNTPAELSGGEQQRVSIARALVHEPKLILADEPTGNLDNANAKIVFDLILKQIKNRSISAIIVTHNLEIAKKTDRIFTIKDQKLCIYKNATQQ